MPRPLQIHRFMRLSPLKSLPTPSLRSLVLSLYFYPAITTLGCTVSAFAEETQVAEAEASTQATFDYSGYHLDWLSPEDIAALPKSLRPQLNGVCKGAYIAPYTDTSPTTADPKSLPIEALSLIHI